MATIPTSHPLSTRLKRTRKIHKLTQRQLADLLGVGKRTIDQLEEFNRYPYQPATLQLIEMWVVRNEMK